MSLKEKVRIELEDKVLGGEEVRGWLMAEVQGSPEILTEPHLTGDLATLEELLQE